MEWIYDWVRLRVWGSGGGENHWGDAGILMSGLVRTDEFLFLRGQEKEPKEGRPNDVANMLSWIVFCNESRRQAVLA